ncbi:MAG: sigma 54-interacting transcriptional regulator, partial [Acidobacteria bacterium]|nr:sigma 54-interacting transcriptional regulator [Acidobacteriota bacterium]
MATGSMIAPGADHTSEVRKLSTLLDLSQTLAGTLNLKAALTRALELMEAQHSMRHGAIYLLDDERGVLHAEAWTGDAKHRPNQPPQRPGEGIIGRVVQTGKQVVIPQVSREPALRGEMGAGAKKTREELSFICIPITVNRRSVGALAIDLIYRKDRDYERAAKFFGVVASMFGQAIKVNSLIESERRRLLDENIHLKQELRERYDFRNIIGSSSTMRKVYEHVAQVARTNTTVLVRGESGTGKELIAQAIHYNSLRASKPLVKVSCAALPEGLIESELFGYEKGAFSGASARHAGKIEAAHGGTVFLDEIADMSPALQAKLLRALEEIQVFPVGSN